MLAAMEAVRARALLGRTPGLNTTQLQALIAEAGEETARLSRARSGGAADLAPAARAFLSSPDEAAIDSDIDWLEGSGARILLYTDADYPPLLRETSSPPAVLYVLGSLEALHSPQLAMVGSRSPTPAGRASAREFAAWFARVGLTVTSGLAFGIDAASHEGALAGGGLTVAVLGSGLDRIYPAEHAALAARIAHSGALVSEFPPRTPPLPTHFPRRNRIIAGLSLGTLVVEAARRSGSLITAKQALEAGREVFAIPGSIHSPVSRGCHQLIKSGAKLVEEAADVLTELKISFSKEELTASPDATTEPPALDNEYEMLLDAVGFEGATIDTLIARTGLPSQSVASMLLILELGGRVAALPGGRFARIP
jgi:DNA processing protein